MFPDLGEFRFIDKLLENAADCRQESPHSRGWLGVGDDCALFDGWLVTKDLSVENTHFRLDWSTPEQAVEKHIVSNVSDISAMGGVPRLAVLGLCINKSWSPETLARIRDALSAGFAKRGISLIGGDTVSGEVGMFSTTLLGELAGEKPLLRSAAKPGDSLFVNGTLGKSAAGLWLLMNHPERASEYPSLVEYHLAPRIDESAGARLAKMGVYGACMDISDGISSELNHIALSSGVSLQIDENLLPIDPEVLRMSRFFGVSALNFALNGGEEYGLLFANSCSEGIFYKEHQVFDKVCRIGCVLEKDQNPRVRMLCSKGEVVPVDPRAWSHL